jgi:hypothetical protein
VLSRFDRLKIGPAYGLGREHEYGPKDRGSGAVCQALIGFDAAAFSDKYRAKKT